MSGLQHKIQRADESTGGMFSNPLTAAAEREIPLLATIQPSGSQRRTTYIFMLLLLAAALVTWPFASIKLPPIYAVVPTLAAVLLVSYGVTAVLLFGQFAILRHPALLAIASGYVFSGLMVFAHALAFPGAFSPTGLNGAGLQSAIVIYDFWHVGLPIAAIVYVLLKDKERTIGAAFTQIAIYLSVAIMAVLAGAIFWLFTRYNNLVPVSYIDTDPISLIRRVIGGIADEIITGISLCVLWVRRRTLLDEWLVVALFAIFTELALAALLPGERYNAAWYAARIYQVVTATVMMIVLLTETIKLYASSARSNRLLQHERLLLKKAEETARENEQQYRQIQMEVAHANRVAAIGQLSASIGHEINQPLSGVITNAETALLWLNGETPDVRQAVAGLSRVVRDGKRISDVVSQIRTLIKKSPPQKNSLDLNEAILEVVGLTHGEAVRNGVLVQTRLENRLPFIQGDKVQLQQVILNLTMNAVEAISAVDEEPREILISTTTTDSDIVIVGVRDSGPGFDHAKTESIFNAFYTTKENGLGMGLSICRSIIEAHGGKLWATAGVPRGAIFQFTLPTETG